MRLFRFKPAALQLTAASPARCPPADIPQVSALSGSMPYSRHEAAASGWPLSHSGLARGTLPHRLSILDRGDDIAPAGSAARTPGKSTKGPLRCVSHVIQPPPWMYRTRGNPAAGRETVLGEDRDRASAAGNRPAPNRPCPEYLSPRSGR